MCPKGDSVGGRLYPYKLSDRKVEVICDALRRGNYVATACRAAGITYQTYRRWRMLGDDGVAPYDRFCDAVDLAVAEGELRLQENIYDAGESGDWRASRWILERRFVDKWGKKDRLDLSSDKDFNIKFKSVKSDRVMDDDERELLEE